MSDVTKYSPLDSLALSRRSFLRGCASAGAAVGLVRMPYGHAAGVADRDMHSLTQIVQLLREQRMSSVAAVEQCLAQIDAINARINAVVALCRERALAEAADADASLARGASKGPLHGVPFTVCDAFDAAGVVSAAGTLGRKDFIPGEDASLVARARAAGAILIGKTITSELSFSGSGTRTGNLLHGVARNAYDPAREAGGPCGGAAAIVAAGGAYFDIGTAFDGSVVMPSSANGVVTLEATHGRLSRFGHVLGSGGAFDSLLTVGPIARQVADVALLLAVLAGPDNCDAALAPVPLGDPARVELKGLRVAFDLDGGHAAVAREMREAVRRCAGHFAALGCKVTADRPPRLQELAEVRARFTTADGSEHVRKRLAKAGTTQASPDLSIDGAIVPSAEFSRLCEVMDGIRSEQLAWFEKYDLLVCPAVPFAAAAVEPAPLRTQRLVFAPPAFPSGTVRCGAFKSAGATPLGVQLVGQPWREDVVLAGLAQLERREGGWQAPA